jgi:CCR4-NOT transcription complex subunit 7/8
VSLPYLDYSFVLPVLPLSSMPCACPITNFSGDLSGYDFGYFLKILTAMALPLHESDFHTLLGIWFPSILDMKYIHRAIDKTFKGGLKDVADQLQVC